MLQGSNSDLFGHRKSFLSAGVSFWGETQSAADNWEEARRPDCVASCSLRGILQPAWDALSRRLVGVWVPSHILQTDITKKKEKNPVVYVLVEKTLQLVRDWRKGLLQNCLGADLAAWFFHQWSASHSVLSTGLCFNCYLALWIYLFEKVQVQLFVVFYILGPKKSSCHGILEWDGTSVVL